MQIEWHGHIQPLQRRRVFPKPRNVLPDGARKRSQHQVIDCYIELHDSELERRHSDLLGGRKRADILFRHCGTGENAHWVLEERPDENAGNIMEVVSDPCEIPGADLGISSGSSGGNKKASRVVMIVLVDNGSQKILNEADTIGQGVVDAEDKGTGVALTARDGPVGKQMGAPEGLSKVERGGDEIGQASVEEVVVVLAGLIGEGRFADEVGGPVGMRVGLKAEGAAGGAAGTTPDGASTPRGVWSSACDLLCSLHQRHL
ncbi:unnamed protein product [Chondrus crispus]|uniref:Uncharacterized protein n=1 Tax=Chondrus crispus TaxID=2769 RepID=R7QJ04_CHOCR|nr:unnamed protein product [Chondrus crispus]CDF38472.1 unnamed protein product [Chondrus crispus]|eukprot:XP_005718365.1 unnamed protein product [Chondrus crispus]